MREDDVKGAKLCVDGAGRSPRDGGGGHFPRIAVVRDCRPARCGGERIPRAGAQCRPQQRILLSRAQNHGQSRARLCQKRGLGVRSAHRGLSAALVGRVAGGGRPDGIFGRISARRRTAPRHGGAPRADRRPGQRFFGIYRPQGERAGSGVYPRHNGVCGGIFAAGGRSSFGCGTSFARSAFSLSAVGDRKADGDGPGVCQRPARCAAGAGSGGGGRTQYLVRRPSRQREDHARPRHSLRSARSLL